MYYYKPLRMRDISLINKKKKRCFQVMNQKKKQKQQQKR